MLPVAGSSGTWPDTNSSWPARTAGEYGPIAFGASGLEIALFIRAIELARAAYAALIDLACERRQRVQTRIRLMPPLIDRPHRLQVRLEPPRAHVVRVAVLPADDRTLPAHFTSLRHDLLHSRSRAERQA